MMIIAGPIYRAQLSFMTILFVSTILLTGPAWCSQLCYFGALDNLSAQGKTKMAKLKNQRTIKSTILVLVVSMALTLHWFNVSSLIATIIAIGFGIAGIGVMIVFSRKRKKMVHCIVFCPVGTIVNLAKPVNPFRMYIDTNCDLCMKCTSLCKYDALNLHDIKNKKPGFNCTYCGDCLAACHQTSIKYKFFNLKPETARNLYLFLTISLYAATLALAKI
jgi:polyferredoxin